MEKHLVAKKEEIQEGRCKIVKVKGIEFGIFNIGGQFYAWRNICPHFGAPVCEGRVTSTRLPSKVYEYKLGRENEILRCPWHGWEFDLKTGEHLVDPDVKLRRGIIEEERLEKGELELSSDAVYLLL